MKGSLEKYKRDFIVLGIGNVLKILLTILITRIVTYYLNYDDYAIYILIISIYNLFSLVFISPLGPYITVNSSEFLNKNTLYSFYSKLFLKYILPISIVSGFSLIIYHIIFINYIVLYASIGIIFLLTFKSCFEIINQYFNLFKKNISFVIYTNSFLFINIISGISFISLFGNNYLSWFYSFVVANVITYVIIFSSFKRLFKNENNRPYIYDKKILNFSSKMLFANILSWVMYDGAKIFGEKIFEKEELGILFLGLAISAQIFSTFENFLNQLILPWLYDKILNFTPELKTNRIKKYFKTIVPILFTVFFGSLLFSDIILDLLVDESKINELLKKIFIVGLLIELIKSLTNSLKNIFYIELKGWVISLSSLIGVLTLILLVLNSKHLDLNIYDYSFFILTSYTFSMLVYIFHKIFIKTND